MTNFSDSQHLLIVSELLNFLFNSQSTTLTVLNWLRTSCAVSITTVATWHISNSGGLCLKNLHPYNILA